MILTLQDEEVIFHSSSRVALLPEGGAVTVAGAVAWETFTSPSSILLQGDEWSFVVVRVRGRYPLTQVKLPGCLENVRVHGEW